MVISDTSYMIDGLTITLLMVEFGQVWAKLFEFCILQYTLRDRDETSR